MIPDGTLVTFGGSLITSDATFAISYVSLVTFNDTLMSSKGTLVTFKSNVKVSYGIPRVSSGTTVSSNCNILGTISGTQMRSNHLPITSSASQLTRSNILAEFIGISRYPMEM